MEEWSLNGKRIPAERQRGKTDKFPLPPDLRKLIRAKILKRVIPFCILLLLFCGGMTYYNYAFDHHKTAYVIISYCFCLFLSVLISGFPFKLLDRSFCGTVKKIKVKTSAVHPFPSGQGTCYFVNTVYLWVARDGKRTIKRTGFVGRVRNHGGVEKFKVGDRVFHLYGSSLTIVFPRKAVERLQCAVCGEMNDQSAECCANCAHTLIRLPEEDRSGWFEKWGGSVR